MSLVTLLEHIAASSSGLRLAYGFVAILLFSVLQYALATARFRPGPSKNGIIKQKSSLDRPPLLPHLLPLFGEVPLGFFWSPLAFAHTYAAFWQRQTVRIRLLFQDVYVVQGAGDISSLVKQRSLSSFLLHQLFLANGFLLPQSAAETYRRDNSGEHSKPHEGSAVEHRNRVEFHMRVSQQRLLLGPGKSSLLRRLYSTVNTRMSPSSLGLTQQWTDIPDLVALFKHHLTAASVDALTGPTIMQRNPTFAEDIWAIDSNIAKFLLKVPRFFNPKAHRARDRAIEAVRDWRAWANANFTDDSIDEDGNDPFWGCSFFRERQATFSAMDGFSERAMACEELSFIWSAQTNAIVMTFWIVVETFRNPEFLQMVREEMQPFIHIRPDGQLDVDMTPVVDQPFLQAMFAEASRLYVHGFLIRRPEGKDISINNWTVPKDHYVIASSTPSHMDPEFWGGQDSEHPVDKFSPGRFLSRDKETDELRFSLAGTEGHWVPFGGGPHACPGRVFAKRQAFFTLAMMVTLYDCEVLASDDNLGVDLKTYPLGTISPRGKVPVRIRCRQQTSQ